MISLWYNISGDVVYGGNFIDWVSVLAIVPAVFTRDLWRVRYDPHADAVSFTVDIFEQ